MQEQIKQFKRSTFKAKNFTMPGGKKKFIICSLVGRYVNLGLYYWLSLGIL